MFKTVDYKEGRAIFIDQTKLPGEEVYVECSDYQSVADAIKNMIVRGAPAIGVAAALGIALGVKRIQSADFDGFYSEIEKICQVLADTRPTAVNLFWAIDRMKDVIKEHKTSGIDQIKQIVEEEAVRIMEEDEEFKEQVRELVDGVLELITEEVE